MAERPTSEPRPMPFGSKDYPFPTGTRLVTHTLDDRRIVERVTDVTDDGNVVCIEGKPYTPEEVQGRIDHDGWEAIPRESHTDAISFCPVCGERLFQELDGNEGWIYCQLHGRLHIELYGSIE